MSLHSPSSDFQVWGARPTVGQCDVFGRRQQKSSFTSKSQLQLVPPQSRARLSL